MTIDELINELSRPIYVWRFARARLPVYGTKDTAQEAAARRRVYNAEKEIDKIVTRYVNEKTDNV